MVGVVGVAAAVARGMERSWSGGAWEVRGLKEGRMEGSLRQGGERKEREGLGLVVEKLGFLEREIVVVERQAAIFFILFCEMRGGERGEKNFIEKIYGAR